jgi:hypothetical protein
MLNKFVLVLICSLALFAFGSCTKKKNGPAAAGETAATPVEEVEKVKPAPGTGNVQGKGGCGGKIYTAKTDKDGDFVITNVPPKEYEGLTVRVFDTDSYVFATTGIAGISATKYNVEAGRTLFVSPTNLFKGDLKVLNPKSGSTVSGQGLEIKWEPYPDAAYYKFSLYPDDHQVTPQYIKQRVDDASSFKVSKPLEKGSYRLTIEAFNSADKKLSETADNITFEVN